jgi:hypothetical protein
MVADSHNNNRRIQMADTVKIETGDGSRENVAYKLMKEVWSVEDARQRNRQSILDLYAECLDATMGGRRYKG